MGRPVARARAAVRLTSTVECAGCAAKFAPGDLARMLRSASPGPRTASPKVLVGPETWDDAGVFRVSGSLAMVQTVDFFPPIVDSPRDYGAIAAANAVSDVYAMGGVPVSALCLVGAPATGLPDGTLGEILRGGQEKLAEAGAVVLGGHTIKDRELKFGYAVTGWVHPRRIVTNAGARPGDLLVLTKPLGTGVYTTALKRGLLSAAGLRRVTGLMKTLNAGASRAMLLAGAHAATDVTGYGLLGHGRNVAAASRVTLEFDSARVPLLPGVEERIEAGCYPGGLTANFRFVEPLTGFARHVSDVQRLALCDPQTSGGLLIAVAPRRLEALWKALRAQRVNEAQVVGRVLAKGRRLLQVV
jgi:selenide, water dikinase